MSIDVQALLRAVECVTAFFLIGLLGYSLAKRRWFNEHSSAMLTRLVTVVVIPVNLFYNINVSTTQEQFLPLFKYTLLPAAAVLATMGLTWLATRLTGTVPARRSVVVTAAACSNTINIGLPVNLALFGTDALPAVLVYYMGNTVVFWTLGNYMLASGARRHAPAPLLGKETLRRLLPPPILGFLAGMALLLLDVKLPPVLSLACGQVGGMTTPLSIICIGIAIFHAGLANLRLDRDVALIAVGRFVVSPILLLAVLYCFPVPETMRNVFIIQATLPPMTNIALLAIRYDADPDFASAAISLLTLAALVTVPAFMLLITL